MYISGNSFVKKSNLFLNHAYSNLYVIITYASTYKSSITMVVCNLDDQDQSYFNMYVNALLMLTMQLIRKVQIKCCFNLHIIP